MTLTSAQIDEFRTAVWSFYKTNGRMFPWRFIDDPYKILVSEIMLQQTQTERVLQRYESWLHRFPDVRSVATASLGDVLTEWNGLGYNRRAKFLHECCSVILRDYGGIFPKSSADLEQLPGIGPYTARAVSSFAYNQPEVFIETNIRSVFIFTFFTHTELQNNQLPVKVADKEILPIIVQVLDTSNPREWYYALMDYGAALKKKVENPSRSSRHYTKQSTFNGSLRQARGAVIRALTKQNGLTASVIAEQESVDYERIYAAVCKLSEEGLIVQDHGADGHVCFSLP